MSANIALRLRSKPLFFWGVALAGAVMLGLYAFAGVMVYRYGALNEDSGWDAMRRGEAWYISEVDPQGAADGRLQVGDEILAINDDARVARVPYWKKRIAPESDYTIRVRRSSVEHEFTLHLPLRKDNRELGRKLSYFVISLAFFLWAVAIGLLKPEQKITRLACIALFTPALFFLSQVLPRSFLQGGELAVAILIGAVSPLHWVIAYHFYYRFPPGVPRGRFWSFVLYALYVWGGFLLLAFRADDLARLRGDDARMAFSFEYGYLFLTFSSFQLCAAFAIFAVIIRNYHRVKEPDQLRRVKWIVYGSAVAILPLVLLEGLEFILKTLALEHVLSAETRSTLLWSSNLMTVIIPTVSSYVILKHHVFDINVVVRRGIQYLLAKNALRLLLALPVIGLALSIIFDPHRTLAEILFRNSIYFYFLIAFAAALTLVFRRRLSEWIDRKFFREAYDQEKILRELIEDVKKTNSMAEMSRLVSQKVDAALHPERMYLFYREEERRDLSLGYSSGGSQQRLHIPEEFELLRFIEYQGGAQDFPFPQKINLPQSEKEWLKNLDINLIVPMTGTDSRLAGLFLLGQKKSEVPYTSGDRQLLETLADQIAIVYENVRLKERAARDRRIQHEVLARVEERNINLLKECPQCGACFDRAVERCAKDNSELTLTLPVERIIEARYRLDQLIGKGGMGAVYEAQDLRLNRTVAVKILTGSLFGNNEALRRFEREAQTSARLSHPNIITVYDYGVLSTEGAYLVLELVRGETLSAVLKRDGCVQPQTAAEWFDQIIEGVKAAHAAGVVHRDLKPENILLPKTEDGTAIVKILDFGLAKITHPSVSGSDSPTEVVTTPGTVMGTFGYMSPEQLTGNTVDHRSDLFSIGVMVVECLTGRLPFTGKTYHELLTNILQTTFYLESGRPEHTLLDAVLQKCLAKDREARFSSAVEMAHELIPALRACSPLHDMRNEAKSEAETFIIRKAILR
jgi:eukaryotic-like serine/threonine-protein kinase